MKRAIIRVALGFPLFIFAIFVILFAWNWDLVQRVFLGGVKDYDTTPPVLRGDIKRPAILVFSKTNAYRHEEAIPAANALFAQIAKDSGWGHFQTENGATFDPATLSRFDAVVFNNVSGDVLKPSQRAAFKTWLENGGGYVGIHAAGDSSHKNWRWYMNDVIGVVFTQHTMKPQFQKATVHVENTRHPATQGLPASWRPTEEWYSFDKSPRLKGYGILVNVDEKTYNPEGMFGKVLRMGDHPMVWWHCVGKGRVLYSAFGHQPEAYAEREYKALLTNAATWAMDQQGSKCGEVNTAAGTEKSQ